MKLSKRLQIIADYVPSGSRLADIGSDHALLPVYLASQGKVSFAVAGEVNPGPFQAAVKQVREAGLEQMVSVRKGDGLAVIQTDEVNVVTIAGMGGSLIATILTASPEKLSHVDRLILQPNVAEDRVRRYLVEHDWWLMDEDIVEEDGKIYEVLLAVRHPQAKILNQDLYCDYTNGFQADGQLLMRMGPYLLKKGGDVFCKKWNSEIDKLIRIEEQLHSSELETAREKQLELRQDIRIFSEVLKCLQMDRQ
ncbi:MAG: SAM-dependent methyltransferase [Gorillibacterium sp.]|nr:SAM-dependent methyltransferase [Gorillibacterium sp.]